MTAIVSTRCRRCGAKLTDRFSRTLGYGPECRKAMTPDQLADAVRANQPGYIPRAAPPTAHARVTNAAARQTTEQARAEPRCTHDGIPGNCPSCRREADPTRAAQRIIALIQRQPMPERLAAQRAAAIRRYRAEAAHQLTIGA